MTYELGTRFTASVAGFVCGVRFNKPASDKTNSHTVSLWDANGKRARNGRNIRREKSRMDQRQFREADSRYTRHDLYCFVLHSRHSILVQHATCCRTEPMVRARYAP